ncbi:MAG TPA: Gfo/Idh/MocA family oxidoreductase [Brevundimonas sp.]|nr:Gfo/Idh/MocA family oxidoreductase [Brevundimonas sp.]
MALSVLIIGGGAIAGGYDADRAEGAPLTHAGAFSADPRFRLTAIVEPDEGRRSAFQDRWGVPAGAASIEALEASAGQFDVISICSPTEHHPAHLSAALALKPRLIFAEKPVAKSVSEAAGLVARADADDVALAVNHTRRWDPEVQALAEQLRSGAWGAVRAATGFYTKGAVHNGVHMIDLLRLLLGDLQLLWVGAARHDFWNDDPSPPAALVSHDGVPVQLVAGHAGDYALFELTLTTERGQITMTDGGMGWMLRPAGDSAHFPGYQALARGELRPGGYPHAMTNAVDNIARAILSGDDLACTGHDALKAQALCEQIRDRALTAPADGPVS